MNSNLKSSNESALLLGIASGDELSYTKLVEKYWQKVLQHALSFVKSYPVAEELTQDIFIQIWEKRNKLSEVNSFENYLFIVSRNLIISHIRKKLTETDSLKDQKLQELFFKPDEQYEFQELVKILNEGAALLQEPRRSIFLLSRMEGKDTEYISKELGLATRTVRWHLLQALNFLRNHLHNHYIISFITLILLGLFFFT
ncbi:RNA polymerase sigma-70 factor, ECF subfamily [Flavobacterium flevense]|uniref:RNA polymerase sigma-70 factor n=1 Tax=Flavobacterium flevense TaxID=983 RepID=A0A4Y4AYR1_9FLAO|nr:sigma-70 family RNA polymerase sigma factor [Flavobacterium flevense]GEC71553.1 RNA polymerase sigma-70 factor [Flavobacterium flevense]SHL50077.1 RNA polymerase sigma-70 factor, ECF subfamily [Flavobacterium flevense]